MSNTKPHENLYNALNQQGYDIGDLEQFTEKLKDAQKRHALYDTISTEFNVGDFDNFENAINYLWSNEDVQPTSPSQAIPQPMQENIALAMAHPMDKVNPALRTQSTKPIGDVQASQNIGNKAALTFKDVEPMSEASEVLQRNADATTPQDPIQQAVSQDLIGKATSQEWQRDTEQHYKSEKERLQALYNKEIAKTSGRQFSSSFMDYNPSADTAMSRDASLYSQALQYINDAEHHMSNVRNDAGLTQGISDALFDIDTLTLGLDSLSKNATLKAILDKADADQPLTEAEESLLNAALYKQFAEAALPNGRWYNVGRGIGEQVPYMLEFALSGGVAGALTKGASKAIGKQVVKYINNLALKNGSKIANRTARNVFTRGSRMLGNTLYQLPGGVMRAAVQVPLRTSVYNDIIERQIGTLGYNPVEKGALDYTGRIDADNTADAITKGLTSGFITNLTESIGGEGIQFITNKIGGLMSKGANAIFKDFRSPRWYNHLREGLRRNGLAQFISASSLQGPVAEWGEEILDQTLNAIFVGDSSLDPNSENYVFDLDNLINTAITTGAISLFMGAAGGIASGKIHRDVNKAYAQAEQNLRTLHYTDTEINALNNIATSRPQEASKWVSSITRTMRTLAIRSAEIENSLSPEARTLLSQPYTEAEFNELSPYDQQAVMALAEINSRFNDLTIQRDYVVAGTNYNALIKGLKESVAPQAEAAMADIQANALRDSDYTIKVTFRGQDGYLVSGTADINDMPDGSTIATLPAGNIYQVRTKSPDGQWLIQQAVAEDITPGTVTPTQQLIDETTARIYTPVQNLITAEQAQAQAEVAQSTEQTQLRTEQAQPSIETLPADPKDTTDSKDPIDSTVSTEQTTPTTEQPQPTTPVDTKDLKDPIDSIDTTPPNGSTQSTEAQPLSTNSTQAKLAHIASWQQAIDVPIVIFHDISEVDNPQAVANIQAGNTTPGWIANDTVYIYLPHAKDELDIDATIMHECIAHFGIPRLFATQEQANAFYDEVWNAMPEAEQYRFLSYPGVSHLKGEKARRVAADEYIAHLAEQIRAKRAGEAEVSLWQRIVAFFRNALRRANVNLRLNDNDLTQLLLQSLNALKKNNEQPQDTTSDNALDANEVAVTLPSNGTETRFSIRSFREEGRAKVTNWLDSKVADKDITRQEAQDIIDQLDTIYDICQEYTTQYAPFGEWSEAQVDVDANGNPILSVIKSNNDYAMNLDFSLVCKKRRTLDAVFQEMIARDIINDFELDGVQVAKINEIIRSYGFETACRLCFVDAKRFRIAAVADTFVELFNEISSMSDRNLRKILSAEPKTVRGKAAKLLLNDPSQRIKVSRSDFMSAEGFERIKRDYPEIMKLYNAKKGTGGPKASFGDVQYLNDIEDTSWTPDKAYAVGGVRLQSFSDYVPRMVFDYVQMIADLAAKRLPVHAHTKEDIFAKQFGLTGIKINLSLVPRVDPDGIAPGLDRDGNYVWQEGETFPYDTAIAIQNAPGYRDNCGTIAVGVSDAHILKMLDDENIRMVIPYHKSGLNPAVAIFNNIDAFVDYTNEQNTRYESGSKLSKEDSKNHFNFNEALRMANGNPRIAAQQYLDWCRQNNYLPKFDKFAEHPNYYKLLEDFTTMYTVEGVDTVVPQHAVEMRFPTEQDAFGSMRDLIAEGLEADAILEGQRNEQLPTIVDEIAATLPPKTKAKAKAKTKTANSQQTTTPTGLNTSVALATANDKNKLPDTPIRFRMTRRTESTVTGWINRRTDLTPDERKAVIDHIDNLDGTTLQLATAKWFAQGTIRIPEDNIQVEQAIKVASRAKVDPLAYDYPQAIISAFPEAAPKQKPINPDDVPTLTNKHELPNDIVVYDVDNSEESMRNMREIINTHLGVDANPWCILQANKDGILTDTAHRLWRTGYNSLPRRVAFHNGRLIAFFATGNSTQPIWWDRQDLPHIGIPFGREAMNDGSGRYIYNFFNEETGEIYHEKPHSGNRQNGIYREWDNNGNLIEESHYSNGRLNGIQKQWDYTRNTQHPDYTETSYVDGNTDGYQISKDWLSNKGLYITSFATIRNGSLHGIAAESAMRSYSSYVINNNFVSQEEWETYLKDHPEEKEWFNEAVSHNPISSDEDADTADDVINTQSGTRFRVVEDADTRERFDREIADGNFVKTYRSMVLIDGELYPPMFSKTEKGNKSNPGQLRQPSHEGDIEQSEEDLSKATLKNGKYYITLIKDNNKETRDVAYNPYLHTASSPLNDQFKEAQDRPNMVTVEMYIPISELTSGYQAEGAHDPVGWKPWPSGILRKYIDKPRKVLLTQRGMVHRIVPDSEVASLIDNDINGNLHTLPTNVFTPSVRAELEKLGYRFINTNNTGKITDGKFAGLTYSAAVAQDPEYFGYKPNPTPPKGGKSKDSTSFRSINPGESLTDYARAVVANNPETRFRIDDWDMNTGYTQREDGSRISVRALDAEENGAFTQGKFCSHYGVARKDFDILLDLGIIVQTEWHHTGANFKESKFYSWADSDRNKGNVDYSVGIPEGSFGWIYSKNKKRISSLGQKISEQEWKFGKPIYPQTITPYEQYRHEKLEHSHTDIPQFEWDTLAQLHKEISQAGDSLGSARERAMMHQDIDIEWNRKMTEKYRTIDEESIRQEYDQMVQPIIEHNKYAEEYNSKLKENNLNTDGKEKTIIEIADIFGLDYYDKVLIMSRKAQRKIIDNLIEIETNKIREKAKKLESEKQKKIDKWIAENRKKGNITDFHRVTAKEKPEYSIVEKEEMNGRYGWFDATSRYNLQRYYSGFAFATKRLFDSYQNKLQDLRNTYNQPGYNYATLHNMRIGFREINIGETPEEYVGEILKKYEEAVEYQREQASTTRFRSIAADNRTADIALDTIEQATADYADTLNNERQAIIEAITPAPGDSLRTIAEKTRLRSIGRMVTKDNASMHLFDTLCNDVLANAARKNDKNALNAKRTSLEEKFTDNKVRVNQLLDKIQQGGGYIRPEDNYWYRENAHKASAQALSRLFKAKYESRLFEALAPIIRLLDDNTNIPTPEKGFVPNIKRGIQITKIGMRSTTERLYETLYQLADYLPFDKLRDRLLKSINDKLDDLNHTDYGRLYLTASYYMQAVTALERQKVKQEGKIAEQQTIIEDAKILADSQLIDVDKRIEEVQRSTELTDEEKAAQIDRLRLEKVRIAQTLEDAITEANEEMDVINEADYGGLAGVQYAIFDLYGMINENVEAIKGDRHKLTVLAQELEIPTVEEFVKQVEDVIGSSQDANSSASRLWDAVRAISEYELETSYMAGLISRSGYQALTYNTDFDGLLKERYNQQKKAILDHPGSYDNINKFDEEGNLKSTRRVLNDNARIALNKLNQEYAEAIDAVPMPGKNGSWAALVETGWLTQQEVDNIHRKYEHYLPLKGHAEMTAEDRNEYESHTPKNQSTIREAKGHTQLARDVITQIVQDALGTIQAAERNKALTLLYKTLTNNQDLAVAREQYKIQLTYYTLQRGEDGKMHQVPYGDINENGVYERMVPTAEQLASGEVFTAQGRKQIANIDIPITNDQRDEHSVSVRVNGEDYTMFFYDKRIADAITGRNNNYPKHVILKALSWINKKMAAFITSLSPAFQLGSNMWRDIQEMFSNTIIDQGLLTALKALGNRFNQLLFGKINKAVYRYQIGKLTPETARTATEKLIVEYFVNGGPVNITQLPDYDTVKLNVRNDLLQYLTTGKMPSDNSWLSRIAERVELASRLSVYIASRNIGKSVNEAIINSKEATVNFDRKGTEASLWGSYIMFFNAIMQGVRRQVQLWRNHPARALATYGFISFSITPLSWMISHAFQQLICLITGDDDEPMSLDEMMQYYYSFSPEYRQRNFILILGRDDSFRLPLALNYLPFSTIGDSFYRLMFDKNSRDDANDMALDVLSAFLETYTPVGQPLGFAIDAIGADTPKEEKQAIKSFIGSALPPVFQPVAQNVFNYNFMGGQLYNEPFDENDNEPYYLNPKAHTQDIYINISQWLSNASGGDEVYAGDINIHPEEIENFFGLFGFFSEFTEQVLSVFSMATDGEDNTLNDYWKSIPVLSRFTAGSPAEYKEKSLQGMFYNDKEELDRFNNMREAYIGTKKYDERVLQQYSPDEQRYFADLATMESISKKIRKEIKAAVPEGEAPKYHEDERLKAIYNLANEQYHSLASGEYKPIDDPYYTYMYIKDQIEKAPHRTTDGTYRLIDMSERSADRRSELKGLLQSFSDARSKYNALPSGYYPGMSLDNREEQALNRFNTAVGKLMEAYKNADLNNLTPTDNAQ